MMNYSKVSIKLISLLIFLSTVFVVYVNIYTIEKFKISLVRNEIQVQANHKFWKFEKYAPINRNNYPIVTNYDKKDWINHEFVAYEASRTGPGEQGESVKLTDPEDIKKNEEVSKIEGLNAVVSDKISVNRSVPDTRPKSCRGRKHLKNLPSVSVIVIFHNEYQSILYRSIHSIYNRTPRELLHEIILVNDKSTRDYLYEPLQKYIDDNFHGKVKMIVLPERSGLIRARMEGAKVATGEVLVFMDAHIEANVNWLPPLIEPIALDPLISTTPVIDYFEGENFRYTSGGEGSRGIFDWHFTYKWLPRRKNLAPYQNAENPIMLGCIFAINRQFYWDLGAYDEELMIWNGENYELSFKLWLCGGRLLEVPCSRVAHTFRKHNAYRKKEGVDFVARNFKRIAEVWLDDYKEMLYKTDPQRYDKIDPGDLTKPKMIRERLKCKPFRYYLEYIAPEILEMYPIHPYPDFAYGAIISDADPTLCIDTHRRGNENPLALYDCHDSLTHPGSTQFFNLTWHRNIMQYKTDNCLDSYNVGLYECHFSETGPQFWRYLLKTHQLISDHSCGTTCLTANIKNMTLSIEKCEDGNINQMWTWGFMNKNLLKNWFKYGARAVKKCK